MNRRLALVPALACLALVLGACGKKEGEESPTQTPYSQSPYAQNPPAKTPGGGGAGAADAGLEPALLAKVDQALAEGRAKLLGVQTEDGSWGDPTLGIPPNAGHTAMAVAAVIAATPAREVRSDPAIRKGLKWLASLQKEDGSIWDNPQFVNYTTSAAVGAFAAARIPEFREVELKARDFLAGSQIDDAEDDPSYGGFPYEEKGEEDQTADLSNLQFAAQALADAGLPPDDVVWKRMRTYLDRTQNHSETNAFTTEAEIDGQKQKVVSGDDGGAGYGPGMSKAGWIKRSDGTYEPRSYGSMTYALLKCLVLAGVDPKDRRVVAALGWISRHFTLERNPGFETARDPAKAGRQGWFYYVYTLSRTLSEYEKRTAAPLVVKDEQGKAHAWRAEVAQALLASRRPDGWWANEVGRWNEASPVLVTSYALMALAEVSGRRR